MLHKILLSLICSASFTLVSAEDLILDGQTVTMFGEHYYDDVQLTNSTINVDPYTGFDDGRGFLMIYADSIFLNNSNISADGAGGYYDISNAGNGSNDSYGAGGAGYGGFGGNGGQSSSNGGNIYGSNENLNMGSRGAAYILNSTSSMGGGAILLQANYIDLNSSDITSNGHNGANGTSNYFYGNGAGSGGHIIIDVDNIELSEASILSVNGGNGGSASGCGLYDGGGGGGAGRILIDTPPFEVDDITFNLLGGDGGNGCSAGYDGNNGQDGQYEIIYKYNYVTSSTHPDPELWYINSAPEISFNAIGDYYGYFYSVDNDPNGTSTPSSSYTEQSAQLDDLSDGTWYVHALPIDQDFEPIESMASTFQVNIKTDPLGLSSPSHPDQSYSYENTNPLFEIEEVPGINSYNYYLSSEELESMPEEANSLTSTNLFLTDLDSGSYVLNMVGIDELANIGNQIAYYHFNIGLCGETTWIDACGVCSGNNECAGCTDDLADNYDPEAVIDDGSCAYQSESVQLYFDEITSLPGSSTSINMYINNPSQDIAGMQFILSNELLSITAIEDTNGYFSLVEYVINGDALSVLMLSTDGDYSFPEGENILLNISMDISASTPIGEDILLEIQNMTMGDPYGNAMWVTTYPGVIHMGLKGDINGDGGISVLDVVIGVNYVLGTLTPNEVETWAADMNEDGIIDVLDLILIINIIFDMNNELQRNTILTDVEININNNSIGINSTGTVAGIELHTTGNYDIISYDLPKGWKIFNSDNAIILLNIEGNETDLNTIIYFDGDMEITSHTIGDRNGNHFTADINIMPDNFTLDNAYPNPFNPVTSVSFTLPIESEISLEVYNLQGRMVEVLASGNMQPGQHSVEWNADSHSSGVYFVKMVAGEYVNTQKLMLVK